MITQIISFAILGLFLYGRSLRKKNLPLHKKLMITAMLSDVALVLFLVIQRKALGKVNAEMGPLLIIHVSIALSTVIGYVVTTYYALKVNKGERQHLNALRKADKWVTPLRILTSVTSLIYFLGK